MATFTRTISQTATFAQSLQLGGLLGEYLKDSPWVFWTLGGTALPFKNYGSAGSSFDYTSGNVSGTVTPNQSDNPILQPGTKSTLFNLGKLDVTGGSALSPTGFTIEFMWKYADADWSTNPLGVRLYKDSTFKYEVSSYSSHLKVFYSPYYLYYAYSGAYGPGGSWDSTLPTDQWVHCAITFGASGIKFRRNGVLRGTYGFGVPITTDPVSMMDFNRVILAEPSQGISKLAMVAVYPTELSEERILAHIAANRTAHLNVSNSITFTQNEQGRGDKFLENSIEFDQTLCMNSTRNLSLASSFAFTQGLTRDHVVQDNPINNPQFGLDDPPTGFQLNTVHKKRLGNSYQFSQVLEGEGGTILDLSCNPPRMIPNFDVMDWDMTEEEWAGLTAGEWAYLQAYSPPTQAFFSGSEVGAGGAWIGARGSRGHYVVNNSYVPPSYLTALSIVGSLTHTWSTSYAFRYLQTANGLGWIAACIYNSGGTTIDITITVTGVSTARLVSFYLLDQDSLSRNITFQPFDAVTGLALDSSRSVNTTQPSSGAYAAGTWMKYLVSGSVRFRMTNVGPVNGVISGIMFD